MTGYLQVEIHQGLDMGAVEMEDALTDIKEAKRGDDADNAENCLYAQNGAHIPRFWLVPVDDIVIGDG